jgi:sirohydrochlorin ferrochelatase
MGKAAKLQVTLLHYSHLIYDDEERKVTYYSTAAAKQMFQSGKRSSLAGAALRGGWAFVRTYLLRLGVLDGRAGLNIARMNAWTTYRKYRKLEALHLPGEK